MVNSTKLKAKFIESKVSKTEAAERLDISATALNYKINGKTEFKATEIQLLSDLLGIEDKDEYFFA